MLLACIVCYVRAKRPRRDVPISDPFVSVDKDDSIWTSIRLVVRGNCFFLH